MQGIAQKILAEPGKYSVQQLTQAVRDGVLPAFIGVPLIQSKVQEKKQAQMGQQAQGAQPGQPSIAQQVMAEAQGVEALPTNLPQNYAGGGIVAFEEGGPVERYQNKGYVYETPYDRMNRENREREAYFATPEGRAAQLRADRAGMMAPIAAAADLPSGFYNGVAGLTQMGANFMGVPRIGRALGIYDPNVTSVEIPKIGNGSATPFFDKLRAYAAGTDTNPTTATVAPSDTTKPAADTNAPATTTTAAPDKAAPGKGGISDLLSGLGLNLGGAGGAGGIGGGIKPPTNDLVGQTQDLIKGFNERDAARTAALDAKIAEANGKVTGKAYEGLEKSLQKEAEEFGADKSQAKNMAIFKAGLAMMAGTSRNALENIGKGAMVGAEDYQAAAKDIKKAQKENERAMAMVEQARRAEAIGDRDKAIDRMDRANEHLADRDKFGTSAVVNATGKSAELSNDIWKTMSNNQTHLAAADLSGRYHLASGILSSMGKDRMTPYQEGRLFAEARKEYTLDNARAEYAASQKLDPKNLPKLGADPKVDAAIQNIYRNRLNELVYGAPTLGGGTDYGSIAPLLQKYGGK
jgi:hypothetical protein